MQTSLCFEMKRNYTKSLLWATKPYTLTPTISALSTSQTLDLMKIRKGWYSDTNRFSFGSHQSKPSYSIKTRTSSLFQERVCRSRPSVVLIRGRSSLKEAAATRWSCCILLSLSTTWRLTVKIVCYLSSQATIKKSQSSNNTGKSTKMATATKQNLTPSIKLGFTKSPWENYYFSKAFSIARPSQTSWLLWRTSQMPRCFTSLS